jgi:hypothetical protein
MAAHFVLLAQRAVGDGPLVWLRLAAHSFFSNMPNSLKITGLNFVPSSKAHVIQQGGKETEEKLSEAYIGHVVRRASPTYEKRRPRSFDRDRRLTTWLFLAVVIKGVHHKAVGHIDILSAKVLARPHIPPIEERRVIKGPR